MSEYTDFIIRLGSEEVEFRHTANSVKELLQSPGEMLFDYFGSQIINKRDIIQVRLNPVPYAIAYHVEHRRPHGSITELFSWVRTLSPEKQEEIKEEYQD